MIVVNGTSVDPNGAKTISDLLLNLKIESATVVIEKNGVILDKDGWSSMPVEDNDRLEVIRFVGGGGL